MSQTWNCVGHNPTTWALGEVRDGAIVRPPAIVARREDGSWGVWAEREDRPPFWGQEPSRETAMEAAEQALSR